ncbi:MAG TPA: sigma-70 family RNA polymerase sigma factor [Myxococcota bacterium]|nr:sigma-70 family RNA polymerase sigma factor [Myxococcota bacterium]HRY94257.1 sigma-70 family RNA polymerase sigma factor [Myxococcota bacterium]HSA20954.1 sigma-70 family RNA polymerase sigma factor [Myxococcota bacterium]
MTEPHERPSPEEEQALLAACQRGEAAGWERLYRAYRRDAWAVLFRVLGPGEELEDLVQQVFIRVFRNLAGFEGRSRFSTWLYRICVHVAMDHLRERRRRREDADGVSAEAAPDPRADPGREAMLRQARARLNQALERLKEDKRNVLVLHDLMEVSSEEIARELAIPPATVRTRLFYARKELARALARQAGDLTP